MRRKNQTTYKRAVNRAKYDKRQAKITKRNAKRESSSVIDFLPGDRDRIIQRLRDEGCTMSDTLSGIIENIIKQVGGNEQELIARWKINKPEWFARVA